MTDEALLERISGLEHNNLRLLSERLHVRIGARGRLLTLSGPRPQVALAENLLQQLGELAQIGRELSSTDVAQAIDMLASDPTLNLSTLYKEVIFRAKTGKQVSPKGPGQRAYVEAMRNNDIVIATGPAGTGKTYLAMTLAVQALTTQRVARIVLTRPAVEAGERLGFLPGSFEEKVLPYLRPLYDALFDLLGAERAEDLIRHNVIEVAPLAFMRGRTLNDAFVILDEAQNCTCEQMKMFLTRLGFSSKMVINGDTTQIDLPNKTSSGLVEAMGVLQGIEGIAICHLNEKDVVRHHLVKAIVLAYDAARKRA